MISLSNPFSAINSAVNPAPYSPSASLRSQRWVKLICGASYQDLPKIRNLALVYALAGVDCIDMAADPAVIAAVREGVKTAQSLYADYVSNHAQASSTSSLTQVSKLPQHSTTQSPNPSRGDAPNSAKLINPSSNDPNSLNSANIPNQSPINPWLMVSLNAGEDPHFRKAEFNYLECLEHCDRPCVEVCPTQAIQFSQINQVSQNAHEPSELNELDVRLNRLSEINNLPEQVDRLSDLTNERQPQLNQPEASKYSAQYNQFQNLGSLSNLANNFNDLSSKPYGKVLEQLCYGCGRCLSVCPLSIINTREHTYAPEVLQNEVIDAIEIHIQPWRVDEFKRLWQRLLPLIPQLKLVAVSFPDCDNLKDYLLALLECMEPLPAQLIWQADGRPMSGDIGDGTTQAAIKLGKKVLSFGLPVGFVQIAGGTNATTMRKLAEAKVNVAGVAYGGYARKLIMEILEQGGDRLENNPDLLQQAVASAQSLVAQTKPRIMPLA
jgi:Fe-S-cluster-containing hydrogenase component 2